MYKIPAMYVQCLRCLGTREQASVAVVRESTLALGANWDLDITRRRPTLTLNFPWSPFTLLHFFLQQES